MDVYCLSNNDGSVGFFLVAFDFLSARVLVSPAPVSSSSLWRCSLSSRRRARTSSRNSSGQRSRHGFFLLFLLTTAHCQLPPPLHSRAGTHSERSRPICQYISTSAEFAARSVWFGDHAEPQRKVLVLYRHLCASAALRDLFQNISCWPGLGFFRVAFFLVPFFFVVLGFVSAFALPAKSSSLWRCSLSSRRRARTSSRNSSGQRSRQGFFLLFLLTTAHCQLPPPLLRRRAGTHSERSRPICQYISTSAEFAARSVWFGDHAEPQRRRGRCWFCIVISAPLRLCVIFFRTFLVGQEWGSSWSLFSWFSFSFSFSV